MSSVSPIGRIVLSINRIEYSGFNQTWTDTIGYTTDGMDQTSIENCFQLSSRLSGVPGTQSVQVFFQVPKNVSHVQILAPNIPNGSLKTSNFSLKVTFVQFVAIALTV